MAEFKADLHIHTNLSDGARSPAFMVGLAARAQLSVVSITDHDTVRGVDEAVKAGRKNGVRVIPGAEISTGDREEIHILAYGVQTNHQGLLSMLDISLKDRQQRVLEILSRLKALNIEIEPKEAFNKGNDFAGRMNIALAMMSHGYVGSTREAFERYLGMGCPAFVPRKKTMPIEAIEKLTSYGCVVALAHPGRLWMGRDELSFRLPGFMEAGLSAMEVYHPSHTDDDIRFFHDLAKSRGLLVTGGSDCHGRKSNGAVQLGDHLKHWRTVQEDTEILARKIKECKGLSIKAAKDNANH